MPIRFRCAYCNQLMGIARRKANSIVNCPRCSGQVIVPTPEPNEEPDTPEKQQNFPAEPAHARNVFEESNLDELLELPRAPQSGMQGDLPIADVVPQGPTGDIESLQPDRMGRAHGIHLSRLMLIILSVIIAMLLGLAFFLGTLFGSG